MKIRELRIEEIEAEVKGLESLQDGSMAAAALIGCGARAIPFLRSFLLNGRPRGIYQPRQLAVETLAQLGAKDVLLEYLSRPVVIRDAVVRMGEDAVRSTAARELGRWQSEEVFKCLTAAGIDHLLPGIVESLGKFRRTETLPYLLWALGDSICRSSAEEAIRNMGVEAWPVLLDAATARTPTPEEENPSSLQRRRWVLRILADARLPTSCWDKLRDLLDEKDPEIVVTVARIALETAPEPERWRGVRRIIETLPAADWFLRTEARAALAGHFELAQEQIEDEIARRMKADERSQALDVILRLLLNLRNQAIEMGNARQ